LKAAFRGLRQRFPGFLDIHKAQTPPRIAEGLSFTAGQRLGSFAAYLYTQNAATIKKLVQKTTDA
jgi:hypothetical protein